MIYRFSGRQNNSERTIEVQLQAPVGEPVDKLEQGLRKSLSQQGLQLDSLQYVGSIDTNFEGIVVPAKEKCATRGCEKTADTPGGHCEECRIGTIHGWYSPIGSGLANNVCVVHGCGQESSFHLCKKHAIPGMVVEIGEGGKYVVSLWLVEREGQMRLMSLNDYALGNLFGSQEAFEKQLLDQGYKIHHLISRLEQLETAKRRNPDLRVTLWSPNLPAGEYGAQLT